MSSLGALVPLRPAPPLRRLSRAGRVDVRELRPPTARAPGSAVRALRVAHGAGGAGLPRVQPAALVHDCAFRALARGARARARRALEARGDLARAPGRRARRARAAASACRRDRGGAGGTRPPPAAGRRPARGARGASWRAGGGCRSSRSCAERALCAPSAVSTPARAVATCAAPSRPVRERAPWHSSTTSTRRVRPSTNAPARCARRAPSRSTS